MQGRTAALGLAAVRAAKDAAEDVGRGVQKAGRELTGK